MLHQKIISKNIFLDYFRNAKEIIVFKINMYKKICKSNDNIIQSVTIKCNISKYVPIFTSASLICVIT